ncbi:hypothetical protein ACHAWF_013900 [Thalassiosira exigua]
MSPFFGKRSPVRAGGRGGDPPQPEAPPPTEWRPDPEAAAGAFSRLTFWWIQPMFTRAARLRKVGLWLEQEDLPPLHEGDKSENVERAFEEAFANYVPKKKKKKKNDAEGKDDDGGPAGGAETPEELERRLVHALAATCKRHIVVGGLFRMINSLLQFSFPLLLNLLLSYFQDVQGGVVTKDDPPAVYYKGYWLSALLMLFVQLKAIMESAYFHQMNRCSWRMKTAISSSVYRKSLRLASSEQQKTTLGEVVNLMQVDATKRCLTMSIYLVRPAGRDLHGPISHPLGRPLPDRGIHDHIGQPPRLDVPRGPRPDRVRRAGHGKDHGEDVRIEPVDGQVQRRARQGEDKQSIDATHRELPPCPSDHRSSPPQTANEALQGILCVKMYTWEEPLSKQVDKYRQEELASLKKISYLRAFFRAYMSALPTLAAAATFLVYIYATDRSVTASTLFASIVAFDLLRLPLMFYPMALAQYAQCKVSVRRVGVFLGYGEVNQKGYTRNIDAEGEVIVENATLYWFDPNVPVPSSKLNQTSSLDGSERSKSSRPMAGSSRMKSLRKLTSRSSNLSSPESTIDEEETLVYPRPVLSDVNISVRPGKLCAIVGPVGSGKSTLCAAILNEAVLGDKSHITLNGKVVYVSQTAWILNQTVRDNILFGLPFDKERYERVIDACCLEHDLLILEDGDMTEIGERGINLSGGQKQRISVARAAYADADVYIFDDPLSALDPEVAEKVFDECILGMLEGKTRLLVTNQLQCLPKCDSIIALGRHGTVLEHGVYGDLINNSSGEVTRLLKGIAPSRRSLREQPEDGGSPKEKTPRKEQNKTLMTKEDRATGTVKLAVYLQYIKVSQRSMQLAYFMSSCSASFFLQAGGGYIMFSFVFLTYILSAGTNVLNTVWVSVWTADAGYQNQTETFYIIGYAGTAVLMGLIAFVRSYGLASFGVRASFQLHGSVLRSVLRAPMSFYDTTPTGRILSRFSKDMHTVDHEIADFLDIFVFIVIQLAVVMVSIVVITPFFACALPFLGFFYLYAMNYFRRVSRETKRLESVSRSPVYSQFSETLGGLTTIRAFGKSDEFSSNFYSLLDSNTQTIYCNKVADRWLACRLESIAAAVVGLAALFATQVVVSKGATSIQGDTSSFASLAGISLSYAVTATGMMQFVVRSFAQVESAMNSVERLTHYTEKIPQEAAMTSDELEHEKPLFPMSAAQKAVSSAGQVLHPKADWPESGAVTLKNLQMRYRSETPLVLKGLSISIKSGQRIGVVGRTGSGKSSMLLVLMRIVEPFLSDDKTEKEYEPPLVIDGVDVMRIGLRDLRSKLGIIPQLPVLFSGTIRSNLDPFNSHSDEEIWDALEKCKMKDTVNEMSDGLLSRVAEYGENLSQGQRQLLCLGRALLKKCKILLLDEATSSVDFETDRAIQATIRQAFKDCTIITIAHRVNTILDSDKILVMDNGEVGEFDSPEELLKDKSSLFSEIVSHSNGYE